MKYLFSIFLGIIFAQNFFLSAETLHNPVVPETVPLFSKLHTLSIHVRDTITHDSVFRFFVDKLKLPVYYNPIRYGTRKYAGVYAGNLVLEPCGPYSDFSYASNDFRAVFFGLTFLPFKSISMSSLGLTERKIPHQPGDSYIYIKDSSLCGENITISFMDKGEGRIEDNRIMDSLSGVISKDSENEPGIEFVKEICIGYKDPANLQKWEVLINPGKLINNKIWKESNLTDFHFIKSSIREVQAITFKVKSLEKAKRYLIRNNLFGCNIENKILLNTTQAFGLQIFLTEQ